MELTGKCKEDFNKWFDENVHIKWDGYFDEDLTDSMQWGVYVDFFDSVGTHIGNDAVNSYWVYRDADDIEFEDLENRNEAIKKANEIYNA